MHRESLFFQLLPIFLDKQDVRNIRICNIYLNLKWQQVALDVETFKFPFDAQTQDYICKGAKRLRMQDNFNETLIYDVLPSQIYLHDTLKDKKKLPTSLLYLTMGFRYNQPIQQGVLPQSLLHLTLGYRYNQQIKPGVLPQSLLYLTMGNQYNQKIQQGVLPPSLLHLTMGDVYNYEIQHGVLPQGLLHLTLGFYYNQTIQQGVLPHSLLYLTFGKNYNQPIKQEVLPPRCVTKMLV